MNNLSIRNIVKYAMFVLIGGVVLASCDRTLESTFVKKVKNTPNLALFASVKKSVSKISDPSGAVYQIPINVRVTGPHMKDVSGPITIKIEPSTKGVGGKQVKPAQKGKNYTIPTNTMTLKESNNYLGQFFIKMHTKGIVAPLKKSPQLKLYITKATGDESVINSGKPITVTLNYACPSKLAGVYKVTGHAYFGALDPHKAKVFSTGGLGQYVTNSIGGFNNGPSSYRGSLAPLKYGVKFSDVCGEITVKDLDALGGYYTNDVTGGPSTTVNPILGPQHPKPGLTFVLKYSIEGLGSYTAKYVRLGPLPDKVSAAHSKAFGKKANVNVTVPPARTAEKININNN